MEKLLNPYVYLLEINIKNFELFQSTILIAEKFIAKHLIDHIVIENYITNSRVRSYFEI